MRKLRLFRGVIQTGEHAIPFGPLIVGSSTEWAFDPERLSELRSVSAQTGGRELLDLSQAWLRPSVIRETNLRTPLVITALILILLDALVTRTGWKLPLPAIGKNQKTAAMPNEPISEVAKEDTHTPTTEPNPSKETKKAPDADTQTPPSSSRSSRFDRAKRKR